MARLYFGSEPMGESLETVQPWQQGEEPKVETLVVSVDTEVHTASIAPDPAPADRRSSLAGGHPGETIASKGEVTGEGRRPMSPAERLGLNGVDARQAGAVPGRRRLFRIARRAGAAARSPSRR